MDTGSTRTLIDEEFMRTVSDPSTWAPGNIHLTSITQHRLMVVGESRVRMKFGRQALDQDVVICRDLDRHLVLGDNFMEDRKSVV